MTLQAAEAADEDEWEAKGAAEGLPGQWVDSGRIAPVQARREVGRGGREEAPVGLFDVARGAAEAFSRTAFPLRGVAQKSKTVDPGFRDVGSTAGHVRSESRASDTGSVGAEGDRVRKRDMAYNAVTGGLASGIGWVIGAPAAQPDR